MTTEAKVNLLAMRIKKLESTGKCTFNLLRKLKRVKRNMEATLA